jgi:branched-chain amino acid transport system substrate-binding protein
VNVLVIKKLIKIMNKKIVISLIVILVVIGAFFALKTSQTNTDTQPVKIGIVLPLTGNAGFLGEAAQKAAQMALEDAGNTKYSYELIFEDDGFDPKKTVTSVNKLISLDKVSALITFGSGTSNAAAPLTENSKIPRFGLASDPTSAKGNYNYVHWTPPFKEGELIVKTLIEKGYKNVAIIDVNHPGPLAVSDAVVDSLKKENVNMVAREMTNVGDKDFRTLINNLKSKNPDIIVITIFSPEIEIFTKQMRELGLNVPVTAAETFEWSDQPELFEGLWFVSDSRVDDAFLEAFEAKNGVTPKPGSAYIYDLVTLLVETQEKADHTLTPEELNDVISKTDSYNSPLFGTVSINEDGIFVTGASVKIMKDGKPVLVTE